MKYAIVDIDGTMSKMDDRLVDDLRKNKTIKDLLDNQYTARPVSVIINLVKVLQRSYKIVFCTGRPQVMRNFTNKWLDKYRLYSDCDCCDYHLLMRPNGDERHDTEVKPELLEKAGIKLEDIAFVLEDRNSMVKKWRELGLTCLQVAEGDF